MYPLDPETERKYRHLVTDPDFIGYLRTCRSMSASLQNDAPHLTPNLDENRNRLHDLLLAKVGVRRGEESPFHLWLAGYAEAFIALDKEVMDMVDADDQARRTVSKQPPY